MHGMKHLHVFGLGYSALPTALQAIAAGFHVTATSSRYVGMYKNIHCMRFEQALKPALQATHILVSIPPGAMGDRVIDHYGAALEDSASLQWVGYYSSTGIYGNHQGRWVDESTPPVPIHERGIWRLQAERQWQDLQVARHGKTRLDIMRLGGIYGPGRNVFERLLKGMEYVICELEHYFSHIHQDDIAMATCKAMQLDEGEGQRIFNFVDNEPLPQHEVVAYACHLLQRDMPPLFSLNEVWHKLTPMQKSFWEANRRVHNAQTRSCLHCEWNFPDMKSGLLALWKQNYKI